MKRSGVQTEYSKELRDWAPTEPHRDEQSMGTHSTMEHWGS